MRLCVQDDMPAALHLCSRCAQHIASALCRQDLEEVFDAVVTDPPYGVRAGARKSVHLPYKPRPAGRDHFPHTVPYTLGECLLDLLESSARLLRLGGRLVYFLPVGPIANPAHTQCHTLDCNFTFDKLAKGLLMP